MSSTILVSLYGFLTVTAASTDIHPSSGPFGLLAHEIIENILLYLTPFDLQSALCLNHRLNNIIQHSCRLKYYFMLHTSGLLESSIVGPVGHRQTKLIERQGRANDLRIRHTVSTEYKELRILGVSDGVLFCVPQNEAVEFEYLKCLELPMRHSAMSSNDIWHEMRILGRIDGIAYSRDPCDLICIVCRENG